MEMKEKDFLEDNVSGITHVEVGHGTAGPFSFNTTTNRCHQHANNINRLKFFEVAPRHIYTLLLRSFPV